MRLVLISHRPGSEARAGARAGCFQTRTKVREACPRGPDPVIVQADAPSRVHRVLGAFGTDRVHLPGQPRLKTPTQPEWQAVHLPSRSNDRRKSRETLQMCKRDGLVDSRLARTVGSNDQGKAANHFTSDGCLRRSPIPLNFDAIQVLGDSLQAMLRPLIGRCLQTAKPRTPH